MLSVTVDRTSLALGALTIADDPSAGLWLPEDGLTRPARSWARTTVSSPFLHGSVQTRAFLEHTQLNLSVYARAASTAALVALMDEVDAAFSQFVYDVTLTVDGSAKSYLCDCADVAWGDVDSGMAKAFMARATLTVPCYPVAGSGGAASAVHVVAPTVPLP